MLIKLFRFHFLPIITALILTFLVVYLISMSHGEESVTEVISVSGVQEKHRGKYANLLAGDQSEIDLFASIKNANQLTIFGSSELSLTPYASYHFLPDSMGLAVMGFGHAYHQNLSILMELLAAKEYLKGADICIVLSPGWFTTNGTNVEAFIEFARPNLLNKLLFDSTISENYKKHVGRFIHNHYTKINGVTSTMDGLRNLYLDQTKNVIDGSRLKLMQALIGKRPLINTIYSVTTKKDSLSTNWDGSFEISKKRLQSEFVSAITNNDIYVYDEYFSKYVVKQDGTFQKRPVVKIELEGSEEYTDFLLVLEFLHENNVNASFIIQPFNPYFYTGTEEYQEVIDQIESDIQNLGFPYLNMYVANKEDYVPGTLKDVMHLGDFGWMTINEFLISTYYE